MNQKSTTETEVQPQNSEITEGQDSAEAKASVVGVVPPSSKPKDSNSKENTKNSQKKTKKEKQSSTPGWLQTGFPPPEYLRFNFAGLNISDHSVKICKTVISGDYYLIDIIDNISLPEGAVVNGEIQDMTATAEVLSKIRSVHGIDFVRLSIPEELIYLATFSIPPTAPEKLRSVVEFHIGDHIPLSIDEINFDFDPIATTDDGKVTEIVAIAVSKSIAQEFISLAEASGLIPLSLEVEGQAIARVVTEKNSEKTYMVLDLGRSRTGISIIHNGVVHYTTTVSFGGDLLVKQIAKMRDISLSEAEEVKRTTGLQLSEYPPAEATEIKEVVQRIVDEINKRESYWQSQSGSEIDEVLLVGGNASTPNLTAYLQEKTNRVVRIPDVWQNVFAPKVKNRPIGESQALGYAAAIGLAISEVK